MRDLSQYPRRPLGNGASVIDVPRTLPRPFAEKIERRVRKRSMEQLAKLARRLDKGCRATIRRLDRSQSPSLTVALTIALQNQFATQGAVAAEVERRTT